MSQSALERNIIGAFYDKLPPVEPTLLQLAVLAIRKGREHARVAAYPMPLSSWHMESIEGDQEHAADAFFSALEAETGISRDMIRELGGLA